VGLLRAGDDQQAGGVAVEPVHDPGSLRFPARRAVRQHAVDERAGLVTPRRMNDDTRRLVDDEQMLVLVDDSEPHLLRHE
jgi:hypothetical protein